MPWFTFVEVNLGNGSAAEVVIKDFLEEVVSDEFLICWVKSEAWRQLGLPIVLHTLVEMVHLLDNSKNFV